MEVHHHAHTADPDSHRGRKKWTHYFWEFLMLFLAVFCGFLAEYQLEHVIERQREFKFAASMLNDLKEDTADINNDLRWWTMQTNRIDTILYELDQDEEKRNKLILYRNVGYIRRFNSFEYHDRTVEQLKNAGYFRLFKKRNVADSLMEYDALVRRTLLNIEEGSNNIYYTVNFSQHKFFDSRFFPSFSFTFNLDSLFKARPEIFNIKSGYEKELFEYANNLRFYKGNAILRLGIMRNLSRKGLALMELLIDEYDLK
jgi:hypothetical protein